MKTCFFTIAQKEYVKCIEFDLFYRSFKYFHPDIPLYVVSDNEIKVLQDNQPGLNLYNIKASAAKLFYNEYDLVVNIDADHFIFDRFTEILDGDYDVAAPSNFNMYENVSINLTTYRNNTYNIVPELQYIQAGLIASTNKDFWKAYEKASIGYSDYMTCRDNDVLNLVIRFGGFNFKLLDGGWSLNDPKRKSFYGCSSLNLEKDCVIHDNIPKINGIPLKCYHVARGGVKPKFANLFSSDVVNWLYEKINNKI